MMIVQSVVSDMAVTVKSRELQRGMLAEMRGDRATATSHFLTAAHLELVLADDYAEAGQDDMALRSQMSAASCFWRAGQPEEARDMLRTLIRDYPSRASEIQSVIDELDEAHPQTAL